jgi:hypothetical protein
MQPAKRNRGIWRAPLLAPRARGAAVLIVCMVQIPELEEAPIPPSLKIGSEIGAPLFGGRARNTIEVVPVV